MAEKWQICSKAKWIEQGEKSTKYFFARYKARKAKLALEIIKDPNKLVQSEDNTLHYIRSQYAEIYKQEEVNTRDIEEILDGIREVTDQQNDLLLKEISKEKIIETIKKLPNNKSSGTDGLTYEFYKLFIDHVTPVLHNVFNHALTSGNMPVSWTKSLITLIPKKTTNLEQVNNWRPISLVNC